MPKPLPGTKFDPATHFEEGDLIYGINKDRLTMTTAILAYLRRNDKTVPAPVLSADHLNNQFLGTGVSGASKKYGEGYSGAAPTSPHHKPPAQEYQTWLEARTKKDGTLVLDDTMKTTEEDEEDLYEAPQRFKRIKRSCKEGIAFATIEKKKKIHFNIDSIDMFKTVTKPAEADQWITAKELRSIFRRWNVADVRDRVYFWKKVGNDVTAVPAPWESDKVLWAKYQPKDAGAYRVTLLNPNAAPFVPQSNLNPNAAPFVPQSNLNPNAAPFVPGARAF